MSLQAISALNSTAVSRAGAAVKPIDTLTQKAWQIITQHLGRGPDLTKFLRVSKTFQRADYRLAAQIALQIFGQNQLKALELTLFPSLPEDPLRSSVHLHLVNLLKQQAFHQALNFVTMEAPEALRLELQQKIEIFSKELFAQCLEGNLHYGGISPTVIQLSPRSQRFHQIYQYIRFRKMRDQVPTPMIMELIEIARLLPVLEADRALQYLLADLIGTGNHEQALAVIHDCLDWAGRTAVYSCIHAFEQSRQFPHIPFKHLTRGCEESPLHGIIYLLLGSNGHPSQPYYYSRSLPKTIHFLNEFNCHTLLKNELRNFASLCLRNRILSFIHQFDLSTYTYYLDLLDKIPADWPQQIKNITRQELVDFHSRTLAWLEQERDVSPLLIVPAQPAENGDSSTEKAGNHKRKIAVEIPIRTPTPPESNLEINPLLDQPLQIPSSIANTTAAASAHKRAKHKSN